MKARTLIDTKDSGYAANDTADDATHNRSNWACCSLTIPRTAFHASRDTLGLGRYGKQDRDSNSGGSDKTANHGSSYDGGLELDQVPSGQ